MTRFMMLDAEMLMYTTSRFYPKNSLLSRFGSLSAWESSFKHI